LSYIWSGQLIDAILNFKRTSDFSIDDYDLLSYHIGLFGKVIATQHVLSQVSDLTDLRGDELIAVRRLFKLLVETIEERFDASRAIVDNPVFSRLGLTDAAIATVSARGMLVLTTDLQHNSPCRRGISTFLTSITFEPPNGQRRR